MSLSEKAIRDFREIYYKQYGKLISDEEAQEIGQRLISLFRIIYRPIPGVDIPGDNSESACGPNTS